MAVTITRTDSPVFSMNKQLYALTLRGVAPHFDCFSLRPLRNRSNLAAGPERAHNGMSGFGQRAKVCSWRDADLKNRLCVGPLPASFGHVSFAPMSAGQPVV